MVAQDSREVLKRTPTPQLGGSTSQKLRSAVEPAPDVARSKNGSVPDARSSRLITLLVLTARKDPDAFRELYDLTAGRLFATALRILRRRDWAEEILQESYIGIWDRAGSYRPDRGEALTWMIAIVRHRSVDWLRQTRHAAAAEVDIALAYETADARPGPFEHAVSSGHSTALDRCLGELEPAQRQSIALAFLHGLSHAEVAEHLQQPLGTVKSWIRRGLRRLSKCDGIAAPEASATDVSNDAAYAVPAYQMSR